MILQTIGLIFASLLMVAAILMTLPWDVPGASRKARAWLASFPGFVLSRMRHKGRRRQMALAMTLLGVGVLTACMHTAFLIVLIILGLTSLVFAEDALWGTRRRGEG